MSFQIYIEDQSEQLVQSVQRLIEAIRRGEPAMSIQNSLSSIAGTVESVLVATDRGSQESTSYRSEWQTQTADIQENLQTCRTKLMQAGDETQGFAGESPTKSFTQKLPPLAFEVAREIRELVKRIEPIKARGSGVDDDFS